MMSVSFLFSLGFASPAMLAWGVAIALPVLIHLWRRRHSREEPWGPMQLLEEAIGRSRHRLQIERGFLLLLRMILILLLVLAVAEPVADTSVAALMAPDARVHRVMVVDGSFSMAYRPTDRSRFEQAKEIIQRIVKSSRPGDGYSLIIGGSPTEVIIADPIFEANRFNQVVDQLRQPDMTLDAIDMLSQIQKTVLRGKATRYDFDRTEVYFLTDLGKVGWNLRDKGRAKQYRKLAAKLSDSATIVIIDLGQADVTNGSIVSLHTSPSSAIVGQPVEFFAVMRRFGASMPLQSSIELFIDSRVARRQVIKFDKAGQATASFSYTFTMPGIHEVELRLQTDQLEVDNRRFLVMPVQETIRVLLVEGRSDQDRLSSADSFLATALGSSDKNIHEPRDTVNLGGNSETNAMASVATNGIRKTFHVESIHEGTFAETSLATYNVVLLANVVQITSTEAKTLDRYVRQGGELLVFLGDQVLTKRYNQVLETLLPAKLGEQITFRTPPKLDPLDYQHPIVQPFQSHPESGLLTIPIRRLVRLSTKNHPKTKVALATEEGDPVIVEHRVGLGRVILVATSADTSWTLAPIWPSFVPLVQKMASLGYEMNAERLNLIVSQPITGIVNSGSHLSLINAPDLDKVLDRLRIMTPNDLSLPLKTSPKKPGGWYFSRTDTAGIYTLQENGKENPSDRFAINVNPVESDLAKLSKATLQNDIWPGVRFIYRTTANDNDTMIDDMTTDINLSPIEGNPTSRRLFFFAILLLALETCWIVNSTKPHHHKNGRSSAKSRSSAKISH